MSGSAQPERADDAVAPLPVPPAAPERAARDIADELADHLACAAAAHARGGEVADDEARQRALVEFGDVAAIQRRCWWIQQGDRVMRRIFVGTAIVLAAAVLAGILMPALAKLSEVGRTVDELREQMLELNATQRTLLEHQQTTAQPLELRGLAYLGDRSRPAAGADLEVWQLDQMKIVRHIKTDASGRFTTGPLPEGQYFLLASLIGAGNPTIPYDDQATRSGAMFRVQSQPFDLFRAVAPGDVELNLEFTGGTLSLELVENISDLIQADDGSLGAEVTIIWVVEPMQHVSLPVSLDRTPPPSWPVVGYQCGWNGLLLIAPSELADRRVAQFCDSPFGKDVEWKRPARRTWWWSHRNGEQMLRQFWNPGSVMPVGEYRVCALIQCVPPPASANWSEEYYLPDRLVESAFIPVAVQAGHDTRLLGSVPAEFEPEMRNALANLRVRIKQNPQLQVVPGDGLPLPRPMKLEVVSTLPLEKERE